MPWHRYRLKHAGCVEFIEYKLYLYLFQDKSDLVQVSSTMRQSFRSVLSFLTVIYGDHLPISEVGSLQTTSIRLK